MDEKIKDINITNMLFEKNLSAIQDIIVYILRKKIAKDGVNIEDFQSGKYQLFYKPNLNFDKDDKEFYYVMEDNKVKGGVYITGLQLFDYTRN